MLKEENVKKVQGNRISLETLGKHQRMQWSNFS